ncbi:MAG: transcription antitermination protein NusB [Flavobacteriales bacterium]
MLSRRHIRIKVLQAIYAYIQSDQQDMLKGEREMTTQLEKVYDLYLYLLLLFGELRHQAGIKQEESRNKFLPTKEELNPNNRFADNPVMSILADSKALKTATSKKKLSWVNDMDFIRMFYQDIRNSDWFKQYHENRHGTFDNDREMFIKLFADEIANSSRLLSFFEEKNVFWCDDIDLVCGAIVKNMKAIQTPQDQLQLTPLWKNESEDIAFAKQLYTQTLMIRSEAQDMIQAKAENWEVDRIAFTDVLIMTMAIAEAMHFTNIPVKVTLNEYIDISKDYSTPRSHIFNNGLLDKIFAELKATGKIKKAGRGLIGS